MTRSVDDLVAAFARSAPDRVARATDLWLSVEQGSRAGLPELRRLLHTIKGEAGMLGLEVCADFLGLIEDVIKQVPPAGEVALEELGASVLSGLEVFAVLALSPPDATPPVELDMVKAELEAHRDAMRARPDEGASREPSPPPAKRAESAKETSPAEPHEAAETEGPARAPAIDVEAVQALVDELRRLQGEQALLQPMLREAQRMLRALLAEIDPTLSSESVAERITKTLGYGWQVERRVAAIRAQWSANAFATDLSLEQLEERVRQAALVPVARLTAQVQRAARSAAHTLGKQVDVAVTGAAHLDAAIEQRLGPALLHLVRNAVDHGIEDAETRKARGKPAHGRVSVAIEQTESQVRVVVEDDGGGIDVDRLRQRAAVSRGPAAAALTDDEVIEQIFAHGVTTRETASAISGRGVGLDVVAREVRGVGGHIRVETSVGRGSRSVLTMPTTLRADLIVSVTVASVRCAIPARAIRELRLAGSIERTPDGPRVAVDTPAGRKLAPVLSLAALFGGARAPGESDPVVILEHGAGVFGLIVEGYDNPRLLSFRPTSELALRSRVVRGVAPSADGGVYLLLDVAEVYAALLERGRSGGAAAGKAQDKAPLVVVAEDAPIARELLVGILKSFGLRVAAAPDGQRALELMRAERPDVVLTDLEMPALDGLGLVERMRKDPVLASVPVVILTTRTDEDTRRRAADAGVRAFLSKQRFAEDEVRRVIEACLEGSR